MRGWILVVLAVLLSIVTVSAAPAQGGPPTGVRVSLAAEPNELTVGDLVTISIVISHPADSTVVVPRLEREWGPFEVQDQTSVQTVSIQDGIKTVAKQVRVTLFAPGVFETPHLPVSIRGQDGAVGQVSPAPIQLTVNSVLSSADEELKDLRPPADLSTPFWKRTVVLVLIAVAVLVLLGGTAFFFHRRPRRADEPAGAPPGPPWEVATRELDRVAQLDLPGRGDMKEHYTLISGILRVYLGATYLSDAGSLDAADMSTEEIAAGIQQTALDPGNARLVIELLQEADLVKFANHHPTAARANQAVARARELVEATRPSVAGARDDAPTVREAAS